MNVANINLIIIIVIYFSHSVDSAYNVLSDFNTQTFSTINSSQYKIYDIQWNELSLSAISMTSLCSSYSIVGGNYPYSFFLSGLANVSYFAIIKLKNLYPAYQMNINFQAVYFETTTTTIPKLQIQFNISNGIQTAKTFVILNSSPDPNLSCSNRIYQVDYLLPVSSIMNGIPANSETNITLSSPIGKLGIRNLIVSYSLCNSKCQNCSSDGTSVSTLLCTTCPANSTFSATTKLKLINNNNYVSTCSIASNYYWTECVDPSICSQSPYPCTNLFPNCTICNFQACSACSSPYLLTLDHNCSITCPISSFQYGNSCKACNSSCLSCNVSVNNCTSCNSSTFLINNTCMGSCPSNYFLFDGECQACNSTCLTCSSALNCLSCQNNLVLSNGFCINECPSNYFNKSYNCQKCDSSCLTCNGSSNSDCISCNIGSVYFNGTCLDNCPTNYYNNTSLCEKCDSSCETCKGGSPYDCLSCNSTNVFNNNHCLTACPANTYQSASMCNLCDDKCNGCNGPGSSNCKSCQSNVYLYKNQCVSTCYPPKISSTIDQTLNCYDPCADGYFFDNLNGICSICSSKCKECENKSSLCIKCYSNTFLYLNDCVITCPDGFYPDSSLNLCQPCNSFCSKCNGPFYTNCLGCNYNLYLNGNTCFDMCPINTTQNEIIKLCIVCDSSCETCSGSNSNECLSCSASLVFNEGYCIDKCPANKFVNLNKNNTCQICSSNCLQCSSLTTCGKCENGYYLTENNICLTSKTLVFYTNALNNPTSFEITFSQGWSYIQNNILKLTLNNKINVNISSFLIINSSSHTNSYIITLKYNKNFLINQNSLIVNVTINYSDTDYEYKLINTTQNISLNGYTACSDDEYFDSCKFYKILKNTYINPIYNSFSKNIIKTQTFDKFRLY